MKSHEAPFAIGEGYSELAGSYQAYPFNQKELVMLMGGNVSANDDNFQLLDCVLRQPGITDEKESLPCSVIPQLDRGIYLVFKKNSRNKKRINFLTQKKTNFSSPQPPPL